WAKAGRVAMPANSRPASTNPSLLPGPTAMTSPAGRTRPNHCAHHSKTPTNRRLTLLNHDVITSEGAGDIGSRKIVANKQQRAIVRLGQGIRKTVAKIQPSGVNPLAPGHVGFGTLLRRGCGYGRHFDGHGFDECSHVGL